MVVGFCVVVVRCSGKLVSVTVLFIYVYLFLAVVLL